MKIGAVSYLNSKPLIYGLPPDITLAEPAALADEYERGAFDIALIPVFAALQNPGSRVLDIGMGADGEVYSVVLTLPKPAAAIKTVSLDSASRTSVNLVKIILARHLRLSPTYVPHGAPADARVLIGTKAIAFRAAYPDVPVLDLAAAWKEYTGLPFVFAAWTVHPAARLNPAELTRFRTATLAGLARRREIARDDFEYEYLTRYIRYRFDERYRAAVAKFADESRSLGLLAAAPARAFFIDSAEGP